MRKSTRSVFLFAAFLAAACLFAGCGEKSPAAPAVTATPEPTAAPTPTPEPTPEPTPVFSAPYFGTSFPESSETLTVTAPVSPEDLKAIEKALPLFPSLKTLDFGDAVLTAENVSALRSACPALTVCAKAVLCGKTFTLSETAPDLTDAVFPDIDTFIKEFSPFTAAESADMHGHPYTTEELSALRAAYPNVRFRYTVKMLGTEYESDVASIDLSGVSVKTKQLPEIYEKLGLFTALEMLDMSKCGIPDAEMDALNKAFPETKVVWMVKLRGAKTWWIRTDAKAFSTALASNPKKQLWSRDVQPLIYCTELEGLDLGHNEVRDLEFLHYLPKLKYLILVGCGIKDISVLAELKDLRYLELFANDITDVSALASCTELVDLNIADTDVADLTPLYGLTKLERLWASRCRFPEEQQQEIAEKLPNCTFDWLAWSPTGNGWRKHPHFFEMRDFFGLGIIH